MLLMWHSGGGAIGSYVGGIIYDTNGNYDLAEGLCGGLCASAATVLCFLPSEPLRRPNNASADGATDEDDGGDEDTI